MKFNAKKILIALGIIILIALVFLAYTKLQKDSLTEDEKRAEAEIIALEEGRQIDDNFNIVGNAIQSYEKNLRYIKCSDSDDGKNYEKYGEVTLEYSYKDKQKNKTFGDICRRNYILEYYCEKDNLALALYKCPKGCENGACTKEQGGEYIQPGQYSTIKNCNPILGNESAPLKILFINLGDAPHFEELKNDVINNQLKNITPFKENFNSIAFYSIEILREESMECGDSGGSLSGSGFACNNEKVYSRIQEKCLVDDFRGIITIVIAATEYGGSGGDIIYFGSNPDMDVLTQIEFSKNVVIHEIGHNFGLADLYYGTFYYNGQPSQFWPTEFSRAFLNVDGFGCEKWCESYKPVSEYTQSVSSRCLDFQNKEACVSFGREADKSCKYSGDFPDCCVWADEKFEYFNTNCVPALGSENIGNNCYGDSGCYYGAVYGNYAWRPVLSQEDSIMYSPSSNQFDDVSKRELSYIFNYCLSSNTSQPDYEIFRKNYSDFLQNYNFKKRLGSCGYNVTQ